MSLASSSPKEIKCLSSSAAFAMSLGAKELFHTNFLAFLLESEDPTLRGMQLAIRKALSFEPIGDEVSQCAVWREKNNLDLLIVGLQPAPLETAETQGDTKEGRTKKTGTGWDWNDETWAEADAIVQLVEEAATPVPEKPDSGLVGSRRVLLVEAKLKSLPRLEQLEDYDRRLAKSGICIKYPEDSSPAEWEFNKRTPVQIERRLLSISGISLQTPGQRGKLPNQWRGVAWKKVHREMQNGIASLDKCSMRETIVDYIEVLGALVTIIDRTHEMCRSARPLAAIAAPTYGAVREQALDLKFKALRISDLVGKTIFDYWLRTYMLPKVTDQLKATWPMQSYVHYSKGKAGLGIELVNKRFAASDGKLFEMKLGVQIQEAHFRLYIDLNKDWDGLERWIIENANLLEEWFSYRVFDEIPTGIDASPQRIEGGTKKRAGRLTNLRVFNPKRFVYSKVDIDESTLQAIENQVRMVMQQASVVANRIWEAPSTDGSKNSV